MQMRQIDEEKRSVAWRFVMVISSVIILLGILFAIGIGNRRNPLEGEWVSEKEGYRLEIDGDYEGTLELEINNVYTEIELQYILDRKNKVVTFKEEMYAYAEAAEDTKGKLTAREIEEFVSAFPASYDYSVDRDGLTLTEREYGEQIVFTRMRE